MKNKDVCFSLKTGFTLIELLISITIGMLIVGFGSISLSNFNEQQKVETVKQELLSNLRLVRNYATTNQLESPGDRVAVFIDNNGIISAIAQNSSNVNVGTSFFSKDITPNRVWVVAPVVRFSLGEGRSINGALDIGISGNSLTKTIKIDESGLIYEE